MAWVFPTLSVSLCLLSTISFSNAAINLLQSKSLTAKNWGLPLAGHKLSIVPLQTTTVKTRFQCMSKCSKTKGCMSVNVGPRVGDEHVCELLEEDRYFMVSNITIAPEWTYVGIQSKCDRNPCAGNEICIPVYDEDQNHCIGPADNNCLRLLNKGLVTSGRYVVAHGNDYVPVYCDQTTDGGGWLVIQRNDGNFDFKRTWLEFKEGFGNVLRSFWWGNEKLHEITTSQNYELRIDLKRSTGVTGYGKYPKFSLSDEQDGYRLSLDWESFTGDIGDAMHGPVFDNDLIGKQFTAIDKDHDTCGCNCAEMRKSGWWYGHCSIADLNTAHYEWRTWTASGVLTDSEMKIRPV